MEIVLVEPSIAPAKEISTHNKSAFQIIKIELDAVCMKPFENWHKYININLSYLFLYLRERINIDNIH